jgi:hypothetical protein
MNKRIVTVAALMLLCASVLAQSTVGELLDKGGRKLVKDDYQALVPFRVQYAWPNRQGEGDLVYAADGTLTGFEYTMQGAQSPATGTWTIADDASGKWCIKKFMINWNARTDQCWYSWKLGDDYYGSLGDDRGARVMKVKSFAKQ